MGYTISTLLPILPLIGLISSPTVVIVFLLFMVMIAINLFICVFACVRIYRFQKPLNSTVTVLYIAYIVYFSISGLSTLVDSGYAPASGGSGAAIIILLSLFVLPLIKPSPTKYIVCLAILLSLLGLGMIAQLPQLREYSAPQLSAYFISIPQLIAVLVLIAGNKEHFYGTQTTMSGERQISRAELDELIQTEPREAMLTLRRMLDDGEITPDEFKTLRSKIRSDDSGMPTDEYRPHGGQDPRPGGEA
ncbi:MAG: SHOCT domain-containing protein [Clostridia bacterium]|nr:SHOCT domain-containing protein [Clostridia bacterium]